MFRNRSIQVKFVKPQTTSEDDTPDTTIADLAYIATLTGKSLVKGGAALMLAYVAADTLRQVTVIGAEAKFN